MNHTALCPEISDDRLIRDFHKMLDRLANLEGNFDVEAHGIIVTLSNRLGLDVNSWRPSPHRKAKTQEALHDLAKSLADDTGQISHPNRVALGVICRALGVVKLSTRKGVMLGRLKETPGTQFYITGVDRAKFMVLNYYGCLSNDVISIKVHPEIDAKVVTMTSGTPVWVDLELDFTERS